MMRFPPVDPASAPAPVKQIFDGPLKGKHFNIFRSMAGSPAVLNFYLQGAGALSQGLLTPQQREAVALAVGQASGCDYCVAAHTVIAKGAGMSDADTLAARRGKPNDPTSAALVRFALALQEKKGWVSDDDMAALKAAGLSEAHAAELVAHVAFNLFTNYFNHANQTDIDFPAAPAI